MKINSETSDHLTVTCCLSGETPSSLSFLPLLSQPPDKSNRLEYTETYFKELTLTDLGVGKCKDFMSNAGNLEDRHKLMPHSVLRPIT